MTPFSLIDNAPWIAVAVGAAVLVTAVGVQTLRLSNEKTGRATDARLFADERTKAAQAAAEEVAQYRVIEAKRADAQKVIDDETHARLVAAQADAASAVGASRRLSDRIAALVADARRTASNPAPAGLSTPTVDPFGLLADVLRKSDERAGLLAEYADQARFAGQACERSYDSLTESSTGAN